MAKQRDKGIDLSRAAAMLDSIDPQAEQIDRMIREINSLSNDDARSLLETSISKIDERGKVYNNSNTKDGRERHMSGIVQAFNAMTGRTVTVREGWLFMVLLKVARAVNTDDLDTYIDMAAYAALAGEQRNA